MGLPAAGAAATSLLLSTGLVGALPAAAAGTDSAGRGARTYVMVSVDDRGRPADDDVVGASVSRDGRWVAFSSRAQNLDRRTRPGYPQVFVRDNRTGRVRAVGADGRGRLARAAETVSISPSGRFVAFCSSDDLVAPDTFDPGVDTTHTDVFVRDLRTGKVRRASTARGGVEGDDYSCVPDVADTGDVAFFSRATNLVAGDLNGVPDYFLYDWGSRRVRRLATAEIASGSVRLSGDGRVAAVVTTEVLSSRDSGVLPDVHVLRRGRGLRGSWSMPLAQDGGPPTDTGCGWTGLSLSRTGRFLTGACADGGIAQTPIADKPVHLWWTDRRTGRTRLVNRTADTDSEVDDAQVSDDGRRVFFAGRERAYARSTAARADYQGVFLWQRGDDVRSLTPGADAWWDDYGFDASGDGHTVVFASSSEAMGVPPPVLDDTDLQLFARRVGRGGTHGSRAAPRVGRAPSWSLVDGNGVAPDAHTTDASISRSGRWMVFATMATNLGRPRRDVSDAYLRDNRSARVRPVAVFGRRGRVARSSLAPAISPNGRFVAFCSSDPRIVRPDSFVLRLQADHPDIDVFVRDLRSGAVRRASTDRRGREANDYSCAPEVADTGDVVFESQATDLVRGRLGGDRGDRRVYLYDWSSDRVHLLADEPSDHAISADGRTVVATVSETLVASDDLPGTDAYVLRRPRRGERLGSWRRYEPQRPAGSPYGGCSGAVDVSGDGDWFAATCSSGVAPDPGTPDVRAYRFHRRTGRAVVLDSGPPGHPGPFDLSLSDDGRTVALAEPAHPLDGATTDSEQADVMIWRQGSGLSLWTTGSEASWDHYGLELSGDGSTLVFSSRSDAMSADDLNGEHQVDLFLSRLE